MDTNENKNFNKLAFILHDIVTKHLRNIFRQEWDTQHPSNPWQDDINSLSYLETEAKKIAWKSLKNPPKSGDLNDWDPTILFCVLLRSKTIKLSSAYHRQIDELREIRNKDFGHPATASINDTDFKAIYQDIKTCMIGLNCSSYMVKQMEDVKNEMPLDLLQKYGKFILYSMVVIVGILLFYSPTCSNSRSFFPESRKPSYYIGHDREINTCASVLANGSYRMVSITGSPAIGKTATAVAVGQVLKNNHGYQVAFVDFKEINVSSSRIRTDIYKDIVLSIDYELENVPDSLQEFKFLMFKITCPTLLIFDNIENILNSTSKSIFYKVTKLCLEINKIKILTTSRKEFDNIGVSIYQIKLEPLPKSQSTGLLVSLLPGLKQKSLDKKIAEKTGGIPLLLEVAASLVRSKYYEEAELLEILDELPILDVLNDTKDMTESTNYYKLLKIVFDGLDPSLQFTFIAFGAIPIFLDQTSGDDVVNFNFSEKVDLYPLVNYNLLKTFDLPSGKRLYGMHPVISEFTRLVAEDNSRWSKMKNTRFGSCMVETSPTCESLSFIMADYSHMTLQKPIWEDAGNEPKILVHNGLTERDDRCLGIQTVRIGLEFYELGEYTKCIDFLLLASEQMKEDDNTNILKVLAGCALKAAEKSLKQGNLNLSAEFSNLLLDTLNLIETDPCFVATRLFNLGTLSNNMRFNKHAAFVLKQAVTYYQQQYQQHNCSKGNLGSLAFKLGVSFYNRGQYNESIKVLLISADLLKSHDEKLEAGWLLATSYYKTQGYETCFQIVRKVLNSSYEVDYHKQKHVFQALTGFAIEAAYTYLNQSNVAMAIQFNILSLNTLKMLETDSCVVATLYFNVGLVFYSLRTLYRDAAFAFNQTWAFHKQNKCGEENLGLIACYLGGAYYHCGQYNDSIDVLRIAVDLLEKDDVHQFIANSLLALSYSEIQEHEKSYQIIRRVINSSYEVDYHKQKHVFHSLTDFALIAAHKYLNQSNFTMTIQFSILSLNTLKMLETDSCVVATLYFDVGLVFYSLRTLYKHAAFAFNQTWAFHAAFAFNQTWTFHKQNKCGEENLGLIACYLGRAYYHCGQYNDSIDILRIAVDLLEKDDVHQFIANSLLALSYSEIQEHEKSYQIIRRVINSSYEVDYHKQKHVFHSLTDFALIAAHKYLNQSNFTMTIQFSILSLNTLKMLETDSCVVATLYFNVGLEFYNLKTLYRDFAFNQTWTFHKQGKCGEEDLGLAAYYLGAAYYHCGQYNGSIDVLRIAVDLLEKDDIHQFMANSLLASSYYEIQEHETCYQITRNILSNNSYLYTFNSSLLYNGHLMNLTKFAVLAATKYQNQGKLNQSIEFYHLSIVTLEVVDAQWCLIASGYYKLGIMLYGVQRHADAAIALNKALEFCKRNECDEEWIGVAALYLGKSFFNIGQFNNSIEVLLGTNDLLKKYSNFQFEANFILVTSYYMLQDYGNSFKHLRKVFDPLNNQVVCHQRYKQELDFLRELEILYSQPCNASLSTVYGNVYSTCVYIFLFFFSVLFCLLKTVFLKIIGY